MPPDLLGLSDEQQARVRAVLRAGAPVATLRTPEELHHAARAWNWDDGLAALREIVLRPDCSLATASLVFWNSLPDEVIGAYADREEAEEEEGQGEVHDLQLLICGRAETYPPGGIGYDPRDDEGTDWVEDYPEEPAHPVPEVLTRAVPGRRPDPSIRF